MNAAEQDLVAALLRGPCTVCGASVCVTYCLGEQRNGRTDFRGAHGLCANCFATLDTEEGCARLYNKIERALVQAGHA